MNKIYLGNIDSKRDWGYAPDYVEAMWMILQQEEPENFVIATGETHSVKEFVKQAFSVVDLNYEDYIEIDKKFKRPLDVNYLKGDSSKAKNILGWVPKTKFSTLVEIMVESDLKRWKQWQNGVSFPWDAANFPDDSKIISRSASFE